MPMVGFGTGKISGMAIQKVIRDALKAGYRHFDCAQIYGNEIPIGEIFATELAKGLVKREELFIASKLGSNCLHPDNVEPALVRTLSDLQLGYLDLYYIHWPFALKFDGPTNHFPNDKSGNPFFDESVDFVETWRKMEELYLTGKVKAIGVSNFNIAQLSRLLENCQIPPTVHQFECHPYFSQSELVRFCKSRDITPVAYSPLCPKDRKLPATINLFNDSVLKLIAEKYYKSVAQVALRYQIQQGIAVIPRSTNTSRIYENINIFDFTLSEEDLALIATLNKDLRIVCADRFAKHKHFPF